MADLNDLIANLTALKTDLRTTVPKEISEMMTEQTEKNFEQEAYLNDGGADPWPDRPYEDDRHYKKLDYTGKMRRSIKPKTKRLPDRVTAALYASDPKARIHNEGLQTNGRGNWKRPPQTSRPIYDKASRVQRRQFMGIGRLTVQNALGIIDKTVRHRLS